MLEKIKQLRTKTGVSIAECKKALEESGGNVEKACLALKEVSAKIAEKKSEREAGAGIIDSYIHGNGKVGVLVDLRCETDFVARNEAFKGLAHNIAMQIAALNARFISRDDMPEELKEELREVFKKDAENLKKPPEIIQKIIEGKIEAVLKEQVLLEQSFVKDPDITISELLKEAIQKFGENIKVARFARFSI